MQEYSQYTHDDIPEETIDVLDLLKYMLSKWYLFVIGIVAGALIMGFASAQKVDMYTSYSSIFIQQDTGMATSLTDVQLNKALSSDFVELASSKRVMEKVATKVNGELETNLDKKTVKSLVQISNKDDTRLLVFHVTTDNAELSACIANAMAEVTVEQVSVIMNVDEPIIVDVAEIEAPNGKGTVKWVLLGALVGLVIFAAPLPILYFRNDKITAESDVERYLNTTLMGVISYDKIVKKSGR